MKLDHADRLPFYAIVGASTLALLAALALLLIRLWRPVHEALGAL
jgi:hypothetical protein